MPNVAYDGALSVARCIPANGRSASVDGGGWREALPVLGTQACRGGQPQPDGVWPMRRRSKAGRPGRSTITTTQQVKDKGKDALIEVGPPLGALSLATLFRAAQDAPIARPQGAHAAGHGRCRARRAKEGRGAGRARKKRLCEAGLPRTPTAVQARPSRLPVRRPTARVACTSPRSSCAIDVPTRRSRLHTSRKKVRTLNPKPSRSTRSASRPRSTLSSLHDRTRGRRTWARRAGSTSSLSRSACMSHRVSYAPVPPKERVGHADQPLAARASAGP